MNERCRYINDFANRSFRDLADQDYILARIAYRKEFDQQFRWCSLQAIEKYLKAILLYNSVSSKRIRHDLIKALNRVQSIADLEFSVPSEIETFIQYISDYGADRYLSHSTYLEGSELQKLDETVWRIRRYCYYMRQSINVNGVEKDLFKLNKQKASQMDLKKSRHKYEIQGGYLEEVLRRKLPAYDALVWKNFFFGRVKKHQIKNFRFRMSSKNPTHVLHPEAFQHLDALVDFPKEIRSLFNNS